MSDETNDDESHHINQSMTRYEALQLIQPLRAIVGDLVGAMVDVTAILATEPITADNSKRGKAAFNRLAEVFDELSNYDARALRLLDGHDIDEDSEADGEANE